MPKQLKKLTQAEVERVAELLKAETDALQKPITQKIIRAVQRATLIPAKQINIIAALLIAEQPTK